ncbi:MAG TPA: hypothetical protein V6C57_22705 [Coleofasciculaceae cyanobacterium]
MFTPEQEAALNTKFEQLAEKMATQFNNSLSGLAKRLTTDEFPKAISSHLAPLQEQFAPLQEKLSSFQGFDETRLANLVRSQFDTLLEDLANEEDTSPTAPANAQSDAAIADLRKQMEALNTQYTGQIEAMKSQVDIARKAAETERETRERLAAEARMQKLDNTILDSMRGKVKSGTERELLTLMKQSGLLKEEGDTFVVDAQDEFGLATTKPIADAIGDLIAERWTHYQDTRPGTGTGATPTTNSYTAAGTMGGGDFKYMRQDRLGRVSVDDRTLEEAARSGKLDDLIKELASANG